MDDREDDREHERPAAEVLAASGLGGSVPAPRTLEPPIPLHALVASIYSLPSRANWIARAYGWSGE